MATFSLEVFAQDLTLLGDESSHAGFHDPQYLALAFQFLDYPLLLVYASKGPASWAGSTAGRVAQHLTFGCGKACMLEADAEELSFLVEQVPLYVSMLNTNTLPRPILLASGSTPILIAPPASLSQHAPGSTMQHAAIRSITLMTPSGSPAAVARVSCRLSQHSHHHPAPPLAMDPVFIPKPSPPGYIPSHSALAPPPTAPPPPSQPLRDTSNLPPAHNKPPSLYFAHTQPTVRKAWPVNAPSHESQSGPHTWTIPAYSNPNLNALTHSQGQTGPAAGYKGSKDALQHSHNKGSEVPGIRDSLNEFQQVEVAAKAAADAANRDKTMLQLATMMAAAGMIGSPGSGQAGGHGSRHGRQGGSSRTGKAGRDGSDTNTASLAGKLVAKDRPARPATAVPQPAWGPHKQPAAGGGLGVTPERRRPATAGAHSAQHRQVNATILSLANAHANAASIRQRPAGSSQPVPRGLPMLRAMLGHAQRRGPIMGRGLNTAVRAAERAGQEPPDIAPLSLAKGLPYRRSPKRRRSPAKAGVAVATGRSRAAVDDHPAEESTKAVMSLQSLSQPAPSTLLNQLHHESNALSDQIWAAATKPVPVHARTIGPLPGKPSRTAWMEDTANNGHGAQPTLGPRYSQHLASTHPSLGAGTSAAHPHPPHGSGMSAEMLNAMHSGMVGNQTYSHGLPYGQSHTAGAFQMSSVVMWELMSLVCMRSVLSSAVTAMHTSMAGVAQQMVSSSFSPMFSLGVQQQSANAGLAALQAQLAAQQANTVPATSAFANGPTNPIPSGNLFFSPQPSTGINTIPNMSLPNAHHPNFMTASSEHPLASHGSAISEDNAALAAVAAQRSAMALQRAPTIAVRVGSMPGTVPTPSPIVIGPAAITIPVSPRGTGGGGNVSSPKLQRPPPISFSSASQRPLSPVESSEDADRHDMAGHSGSAESIQSEEGMQSVHDDDDGPTRRQPKAAPTGGWQRSSTFRPSSIHSQMKQVLVNQSVTSDFSYEQDFEDASSPPTQRRPQNLRDGKIVPAWEEDIPDDDLVEEVEMPQSFTRSTRPISRASSINTEKLLASTESDSSRRSSGGAAPRSPLPQYSPRTVNNKPPALKSQPLTSASRKSTAGRVRKTEKGGSDSGRSSDVISSVSSGGGLMLSQLSPGQKKAVGFRDAQTSSSESGKSAADAKITAKKAKSIAMSEVSSFFSSPAESFEDEDEDEHTRSEELDTVRSLHHARVAAARGGVGAVGQRKSRSGSHRRQSTTSVDTSLQSGDISWTDDDEDDDDDMDNDSIDIVSGDAARRGLQQRMSIPPPPRRLNSAQRDSSKSFMITASDIDLSDDLSIEFDAEELASGLTDQDIFLANKRRSNMGGIKDKPQPRPSAPAPGGWQQRRQADISYDDPMGETADIMEEISNLSSQY